MQNKYPYLERFLDSSDPFEMASLLTQCFEESESHPKGNVIQSSLGILIELLEIEPPSLAGILDFEDKKYDAKISQGSDKKGKDAQRKECDDWNLEGEYSSINEFRDLIFSVQHSIYLTYYGTPKPTVEQITNDIEKTNKKKKKKRKNQRKKPQSDVVDNNGNNSKSTTETQCEMSAKLEGKIIEDELQKEDKYKADIPKEEQQEEAPNKITNSTEMNNIVLSSQTKKDLNESQSEIDEITICEVSRKLDFLLRDTGSHEDKQKEASILLEAFKKLKEKNEMYKQQSQDYILLIEKRKNEEETEQKLLKIYKDHCVNIYRREVYSRIISFFQESINNYKKTSKWRSASEIYWDLPFQTRKYISIHQIQFIKLLNQMITRIWNYNSVFHGARTIENINISAKEILLSLEESEENKEKFVELIFKLIPKDLLDLSKRKNLVVQASDLHI